MEKMFSRLRSMSGGKLKSPTASSPPSQIGQTPSKEDILTTLDGFGEKIPESACLKREDNNNVHLRRSSNASVSGESMDVASSDTEPTITSITHSYSVEWEKLFLKPNYAKHLRNYALKGNLRSSRFRSIAWKLFLEVLPEDSSQWVPRTRQLRNKYRELKDKLIVNPRKAVDAVDVMINNPLSQEEESPWNRFFMDNELRLTIKQDVIRTYPRIEFFQSNQLRNLMVDILFIYAKLNPEISYRQGMHELLAPMIFVLHCDHQAFLHASEMETLDERIKFVMDPKYLEHDAYAMFAQVMQTMEPWYVSKEVYPTKSTDPAASQPFARPQDMNPSNVIVTKLTRIQDYLLRKADHELHLHLERHEIAPQIYGIRWIRLLFGREFPMQDLLVLWDAIFADGIGFDLVDYIFVAMLLYLRDHLLSSDYPSCLITLMRYPPVGDIHYFIEKARHLRDPHQIPRPPTYTYQSVQTAERAKPKPAKLSPTPGEVPQHKRGSSASLSQVEDTMFRSAQSSASFGTQSLRSAVSTPGDGPSVNGSPTKFSTLPSRTRSKSKKHSPTTTAEEDSSPDTSALRGLLNDKESMCKYCSSKLDHHIESLQLQLLRQSLENEDEILVAIAGIKQVRDVLKGTLRFSRNLLDEDEISINDNHYKMDTSSGPSSEDSSPEAGPRSASADPHCSGEVDLTAEKRKLFYVSSEENSEAMDSPSDPLSGSGHPNINFKLPVMRDFEMEDLKNDRTKKRTKNMYKSGGPNDCESDFSKSWSPDSNTTDISGDSELEESPNPLYRIRGSSYHE